MKNPDFGKMRKSVKRAAAVVLSAAMIFTECLPAFAEGLALDTPDLQLTTEETEKVTRVPAERSTGALDEVEEKSIVYFGTASLTAGESEWTYEIPLYRDGDLSEGETVVIHSLDMTALYGRDYVLLGEGRTENESEITLLEESVKNGDSEATTSYQYDSETGELSVAEKDEEAAEEVMPVEAEEIGDDQEGSAVKEEADPEEEQEDSRDEEVKEDEAGMEPAPAEEIEGAEQEVSLLGEAAEAEEAVEAEVIEEDAEALLFEEAEELDESPEMLQADEAADAEESADLLGADGEKLSLSMVKQLATGEQVRITQSAESTELSKLLAAELMPSYLAAMKYSCEQIFTFAPGESEKTVTVKILDDDLSEGSETFSLVICEAGSSAIVTPLNLSVIIEDDEEYVPSEISFTKDKYEIEDGVAKITLERRGQEQSLATVMVSKVDSETGEQTACAEAVFTPYSTEVEVELELAEATELALTDFAGAEGGEIVNAEAGGENLLGAAREFNINVSGKQYKVKIGDNDKISGTIWDESYKPALEVGRYYLPIPIEQGGDFTYGFAGDDASSRSAYYDSSNNRGYCYWYDWRVSRKGTSHLANVENGKDKRSLNSVYFQYVCPDWEQTRYAYGGQMVTFMATTGETKRRYDQFGRMQDAENAVVIKKYHMPLNIIAAAVDEREGRTPKIEMYYYGTVCMYKCFNVKKKNLDSSQFSFISGLNADGSYSYIHAVPANVALKCGAQVLYGNEEKNFYANPDEKQSNMVWTLSENTLYPNEPNGRGIYGRIKGFEIKISDGIKDLEVNVNYPEDFIGWLNSKRNTEAFYNSGEIDSEIRKVNNDLSVIPYDKFFIDFIENKQKDVRTSNPGYYQVLGITPKFEYSYVNVKVLAPETGSGTGWFKDKKLSGAEGKAKTDFAYKAGDRLDLSVIAKEGYLSQGYEVSVDGGINFNTIRDRKTLILAPNRSYIIRPCITEDLPCIEIKTNGSVKDGDVTIAGLVPQYVLKGSTLEGKNILDINPKAQTLRERVEPEVGKIYPITVIVNTDYGDNVKVPFITDPVDGKAALAYQYYAVARSQQKGNIYTLKLLTWKKTSLNKVTLKGKVVMKAPSIRDDGTGTKNVMLSGYTIMGGTGIGIAEKERKKYVTIATSQIDNEGNFILKGFPGQYQCSVRLLVTNGLNCESVVTANITAPVNNIGVKEIEYPYSAPEVISVLYEYDFPTSHPSTDYRDNTIRCYENENISLTAIVDLKGRSIEKAVFTVYHADGKKSLERTGFPVKGTDNQFTCKIDDMMKNLYNGDYVTVQLVDKEKAGDAKIDILYPARRTGLKFQVLNELVKPKNFDVTLNDSRIFGQGKEPTVNVPLFGPVTSGAMSGNLSLNKVDWPGGKGFSLLFNFDALIKKDMSNYSIEDRLKLKNRYKAAADNALKAKREAGELEKNIANKGERAEQIIAQLRELSKGNGSEADMRRLYEDLNNVNKAIAYEEEIKKKIEERGITTEATLNKSKPLMNFDVLFAIDFEFILNPKTKQYVLATCSATIGGSFAISKTFYTAVVYVPVFLTLGGSVQVNVMMGGACPAGIKAVTAGDFNGYQGNVTDLINQGHKFTSEFDLILQGNITAGAGLAGVLSVRGRVTVGFQLQLLTPNISKTRDRFGTILSATGGIGFDVLIVSIDITVADLAWGTGNLRDQTKVRFFNNGIKVKDEGDLSEPVSDAALTGTDPDDPTETVEAVGYNYGGSVAENFVNEGTEAAGYKNIEKRFLLEDAPEHIRPEIVDIGEGRFLMTFIGKREGQGDESCLYYSVSDANGVWSDPKPVDAADSTFDSEASVIRTGDKVVIAWVDADKPIDNIKNFKDQYNSLSISAAVYDIESATMSEKVKVSGGQITLPNGRRISDVYFDCKPVLTASRDKKVYCTFVTRDIDAAADITQLTDITGLYSTVRQSVIDVSGDVPTATEPAFITVRHEREAENPDPLTYDYCTQSITSEGEEYILNAYSIDTDGDFKTADDKAVYLSISDPVTGESYYPFKVSREDKAVTNVQLNKLGDEIYLTWLSEGKEFNILQVNDLIDCIFHSGSLVDDPEVTPDVKEMFAQISELLTATPSDASWIRESRKADIFNKEKAGENYLDFNETIYGQLADNDLYHVSRDLTDGRGSGNIDEYRLVSDADGNVFVFYTDYVNEYQHYGKELFGMQYVHSYKDSKNGGTEDDGLLEAISAVNRLTEPVQMTDFNALMDEFDVEMDSKTHEVYVMTNYMTDSSDQGSSILHGSNKLAELIFAPSGSVEVDEGSVGIIGDLVSGENVLISFSVSNNGILDAEGYSVDVFAEKDGKQEKVGSKDSDKIFRVNASEDICIPWKLPDDIRDLDLVIKVNEKETSVQAPSVVTYRVPYEEGIEFSDVSMTVFEGKVTVGGVVKNAGFRDADTWVLKLMSRKYEEEEKRLICAEGQQGLKSGESRRFSFEFIPQPEDFDEFGILGIELTAERDEEILSSEVTELAVTEPMVTVINGGEESVTLKPGTTLALEVSTAPWGDLSDDVFFYSEDESIAEVSDEGLLTAGEKGKTEVTVYYPVFGVYDSIEVVVSDSLPPTSGSGSSETALQGPASARPMYGTWKAGADGTWTFVTSSGDLFKGWGYIRSGSSYDYYHMGADGTMDHGWYYDEKLQKWYYLNENHDGRFGAMMRGWHLDTKDGKWYYLDPKTGEMCTGWVFVNGKWYYLSTGSGVPVWVQNEKGEWVYSGTGRAAGSMYANEKTPDGYTVDANGAWTENKAVQTR